MKYRLVLAIGAMKVGGVERYLLELARHIDRTRFEVHLAVKDGHGEWLSQARDIDRLHYHNFGQTQGHFSPLFPLQLNHYLRRIRPHFIYSFLPGMNIYCLGQTLALPPSVRLVWGIQCSQVDLSNFSTKVRYLMETEIRLAFVPDLLISNSHQGLQLFRNHRGRKFRRACVIPNGTDYHRFRRDPKLRAKFRRAQGLTEDDLAVGLLARVHPMKGHEVLAQVAAKLLDKYPNLYFFCAGEGEEEHHQAIVQTCRDIVGPRGDRFVWLPFQNPTEFWSGQDFFVSPSLYGEGLSNSIVEALSCRLTGVVTRVGDSHRIAPQPLVSVVPPGSVDDLYRELDHLISRGCDPTRGKEARRYVIENYSPSLLARRTEDALVSLIKR